MASKSGRERIIESLAPTAMDELSTKAFEVARWNDEDEDDSDREVMEEQLKSMVKSKLVTT